MERRIVNSNDEVILDTLKYDICKECILGCIIDGYAHKICPIDHISKRNGFLSDNKGKVIACSEKAKSTRNFKIELQNSLDSIPQLNRLRNEIENEAYNKHSKKVEMLVHNLRSQNAHAIQELYNFVTEDEFLKNINASVDTVKTRIESRTRFAAVLFLRLAKINSSIDNEIFIYENLIKPKPNLILSPRFYNLRDVVMLFFHEFMADFTEKKIYIDTQEYYERAKLDFRTTRFVIYHIISNSSKYTKPNTSINVSFDKTNSHHIVRLAMISYYMSDDVLKNMYDEGYSGQQAKDRKTAGQGLGMFLVNKVMKLNGMSISIIAGKDIIKANNIDYANNVFDIQIPYNI